LRPQAHFKGRLAEARKVVPDPVQENVDEGNPRIKLKLGSSKTPEPASQRLMLRFSGQKSSSVEDKTPASASLDSDSLQKQQELAKADIAGHRPALSTAQESRETPDYTRLGPAAHVLGQGSPIPTSIITPSPSQTPIPSTVSADVLMHSMTGGHDQMINPWSSGIPMTQPYQSYASVESIFRKASQGKLSGNLSLFSVVRIHLLTLH
jgi:chromatin structure-remodeling complex subunit RSC4